MGGSNHSSSHHSSGKATHHSSGHRSIESRTTLTGVNRQPTNSSYYDFGGVPCGTDMAAAGPDATFIHARDAREQVANAPPPVKRRKRGSRYPSGYSNHENLPLQVTPQGKNDPNYSGPPYTHAPLLPGQSQPWTQGNPGAYRSIYDDSDRSKFDAIYHDPNKAQTSAEWHQFSKAKYYSSTSTEATSGAGAWANYSYSHPPTLEDI